MLIRFIDFQKFDPFLNMAIDESISFFVRQNKVLPTFRLYGWNQEAVTIGEFQKIEEINRDFCISHKIPIIRRLTGGKGILHYDDITYSFCCKKDGEFRGSLFKSYEILSQIFLRAFSLVGISAEIKRERKSYNKSALCFAISSFGEICFQDIKIIGAAQKRWIDGFLQQGNIPLRVNRDLLKRVFFCKPEEADRIFGLKELFEDFDIQNFQQQIKKALKEKGFEIVEDSLQAIELAQALSLQQKYRDSYNKT